MALEPGQEIDRYVVDSVLGQGGMAVVYKVKHKRLGSWHALKLLTMSSNSIRERLVQEGRVQATLAHPNIVAVTDILDIDGAPGLVMEYIAGSSLDTVLEERKLSLEEAEKLFRGIVAGVGHAHSLGVVHRDLKPANVMLYVGGGITIPKVADFGLAKALADDSGGGMGQTRSGVAMGTPAYMAPEQIRDAKNVDGRADIFSLGCILYELITGRGPFTGPDILSIFNAVASGSYPPAVSLVPDIPEHLLSVIEGCLQVDRARRLPDCAAIQKVLDGTAWQLVAPAMPAQGQTWSGEEHSNGGVPLGSIAIAEVPRSVREGTDPSVHGTMAPTTGGAVDGSLSPASKPPSQATNTSIVTAKRGGLAVLGIGGLAAAAAAVMVVGGIAVAGGWFYMDRAATGQMRNFLNTRTGGEVTFKDLQWRPGSVVLTGVSVKGSDGQQFAHIGRVRLTGKVGRGDWKLKSVDVSGLSVDIRRDSTAGGWVVPTNSYAIISGNIKARDAGFRIAADTVMFREAAFEYRGAADSLVLKWDKAQLDNFVLTAREPVGWTSDRAGVFGLVIKGDDKPWFRADAVKVEDGKAVALGFEGYARMAKDGRLELPEAAKWEFASWIGGSVKTPIAEPWLGFDLSWLPAEPTELRIADGKVHVEDRANAPSGKDWEVAVDSFTVGPVAGEYMPYKLRGKVDGAKVDASGDMRKNGLIRGAGSVTSLPLERLAPYFEPSEKAYGVSVDGGKISADVDYSLLGTAYAGSIKGSIVKPSMARLPGSKSSSRTDRLLRARNTVEFSRDTRGDLATSYYAPVNRTFRVVVDAVFEPAGGAVWPTAKGRSGRSGSSGKSKKAPGNSGSAGPPPTPPGRSPAELEDVKRALESMRRRPR